MDILYQQASTAADANGTAHYAEQDPQDDDILDAEEQADSEVQEPEPQRQQELSKPQQPPPPQQQPSKAAAAASEPSVNGLDDGSADEEDEEDADAAAADEDGQAKKPKKRRGQKKKKKKKSKGGSAPAEEAVQDSSSAAAASNSNEAAAAEQSSKEDEDTDVFFDAPESMSANDEAASQTSSVTSSSVQAGASGKELPAPAAAAVVASRPAQIDAAAGPRVPDSFTSENYLEFFNEEPCAGTSWLPTQTEEPQQPANLLQGPAVAACLDRHEYKGEDKGLKVVGASWTPAGSSGEGKALEGFFAELLAYTACVGTIPRGRAWRQLDYFISIEPANAPGHCTWAGTFMFTCAVASHNKHWAGLILLASLWLWLPIYSPPLCSVHTLLCVWGV